MPINIIAQMSIDECMKHDGRLRSDGRKAKDVNR